MSADYEALKTEHNKLKQIIEVSRARNICLTRELKTLTAQLSALKVKSQHDNELVEALVVRNHNYIYICKNWCFIALLIQS